MGFDFTEISDAVTRFGQVSRVVIARVHGSAPREVGAAMLIWQGGQSGTIGGGQLEYEMSQAARQQSAPVRFSRHALGPQMGQCCGGAVEIVTEVFTAERLKPFVGQVVIARPVTDNAECPLAMTRLLSKARAEGDMPATQLLDGWMIEPLEQPSTSLWIWGAGARGARNFGHTFPSAGIGSDLG